jgi:hypothetical protein
MTAPSDSATRRFVVATLLSLAFVSLATNVAAAFPRIDLAKDKPWRTSSTWATCEPALHRCGGLTSDILFHTADDDSPWFEVDLQRAERVSSLTILNRQESDSERARPLLVEVSEDATTWQEVARHDELFLEWRPSFSAVTARYVRVRIPRKTWLHLEAVRVHP